MSKVYGYCRTARAEGNNMEEQCELIKNYCKTKGMHIEEFFCDEGMSAHNLNRQALSKLFDVLGEGDVVVTKDISRFARDPQKREMLVDKVRSMGVEIVYANEEARAAILSINTWLKERLNK